jgi:hypothetical protein
MCVRDGGDVLLCKQVSKRTQDEMVDLSMGLSAFMSQIEDKLSSKADVKALLQKASWTEVRDLMADLSAHMGEKINHTSTEIKGLQQKISNMGDTGGNALGVLKCISCSRPIAAAKTEGHVHFWSKNPMDPELMSGGDAHVQRIKTVNAHLHHADKMPAIDGARPSAVFFFAPHVPHLLYYHIPPALPYLSGNNLA